MVRICSCDVLGIDKRKTIEFCLIQVHYEQLIRWCQVRLFSSKFTIKVTRIVLSGLKWKWRRKWNKKKKKISRSLDVVTASYEWTRCTLLKYYRAENHKIKEAGYIWRHAKIGHINWMVLRKLILINDLKEKIKIGLWPKR